MGSRGSGEVAGQRVANRYVVEEMIGRGGNAAVYRVRDAKTGKQLAAKRALAAGGKGHEHRRTLLEREYHTLAQLAHPRIIEVYDFGIDDDGPYYIMELLGGEDLASGGRQPWRRACALLCDVASSLAILHARGLLHRDVSARNVRCTADGRAKLIDFGALSSIGVSLEVVGTPPYVSPEALQLQALDARSDLFALGALAYYLLSGRHAYPAHRFAELRDVWRSPAQPLSRIVPELPLAVSALVMQLLALDRLARPDSAAEVMHRLSALAELPVDDDLQVSRAYLTAPVLVGRKREQLAIRKRMLSLARGDGGALLISGHAGSGRSRLLDVCVLEGRLLGAQVLRVDGGALGEWALAKQLCLQLVDQLPELTAAAARLAPPILSEFIAAAHGPAEPERRTFERGALLRSLRDFVLAIAAQQRVLLVVDDVDRSDEPSLALLAALVGRLERHALVIALAVDSDNQPQQPGPLRLLHTLAERLELEPLEPEQTAALLGSVFGDVPNLALVCARVHALAHGNPRATLELAEHLVQRGLARYEAGSWSLPAALAEHDFPRSMAVSLSSRLARLSQDARELVDLTALSHGATLCLADYTRLCASWELGRLFAALHELVSTRVLLVQDDVYRFTQRGFIAVAGEALAPVAAGPLHARIAQLLAADGGDVLLRAQHLLAAGDARAAVELLLSAEARSRHASVSLLESALEQAQAQALPESQLRELRLNLLTASALALDFTRYRRWGAAALEALRRDSGLALYEALHGLPDAARLSQALGLTEERYLATPERERGYPVDEAIRKLVRLANGYALMGILTSDLEALESFPSLQPFKALSPAVSVMAELLEAARHWIVGRFASAVATYTALLSRLEGPDLSLDPAYKTLLAQTCHNLIGLRQAQCGIASAELHARMLEADRAFRPNAFRVRQIYHLSQGDVAEAQRCQRRAELHRLQATGLDQHAAGGDRAVELLAHALTGDMLAISNVLKIIALHLPQAPHTQPLLYYGQSVYRALQGDFAGALTLAEAGLPLAPAGRHWCFVPLATAHVRALLGLGQLTEAVEQGRAYLELIEREGLHNDVSVHLPLALALAASGQLHAAVELAEQAITSCLEQQVTGVALGNCYETRAYVALHMHDDVGFERAVEACAGEFRKGHNPVLASRFELLLEAARQQALTVGRLDSLARELALPSASHTDYATVHSRLGECGDATERAYCALSILLQQAGRPSGCLFAVTSGGPQLLAALPDVVVEPARQEWVRRWLEVELDPNGAVLAGVTATAEATTDSEVPTTSEEGQSLADATHSADTAAAARVARHFVDEQGHSFEVLLLTTQLEPRRLAALALVLEKPSGARLMPDRRLVLQLLAALCRHGDLPLVALDLPGLQPS